MAASMPSLEEARGETGAETGHRRHNDDPEFRDAGFASSSFQSYRHERVPTPTPAVGSYDLRGSMLKRGSGVNQRGSSSLLSETKRHVRDLQRERQPGPGAYDPHLVSREAASRRLTTRTRALETDASVPRLDDIPPEPTPGPAHYAPELLRSGRHGGAHSAFRSGMDRLSDATKNAWKSPSPAEYNDLTTRYTSGFTSVRNRTGSIAPFSSSFSRPSVSKIQERGALEIGGVAAAFAAPAAAARRRASKDAESEERLRKDWDDESGVSGTARVTSAAAVRSVGKPGLPRNAPTPLGYTSFEMRRDAREMNAYALDGCREKKPFSNALVFGRNPEWKESAAVALRNAKITPAPHAHRAPAPRMRLITGNAEIVAFYELGDRAFEVNRNTA